MTDLHWLPSLPDWRPRLRALAENLAPAWDEAAALANARLNFVLTNGLDETVRRTFPDRPATLATKPVRLAVLGSSTLTHLLPAISVGGLRCGLWVETCESDFGQYRQELANAGSALHAFAPSAIMLALDAYHLGAGVTAAMDAREADAALTAVQAQIADTWRLARGAFRCPIIQQTALPAHLTMRGSNEHRLPGSRALFVIRLNMALREMAGAEGVDLLALDDRAARDGIAPWHDPALWHRSKQEVVPLYGDLVGRLLAAKQGRSSKCLVLDLDNTVWGGVIGDNELDGVVLGQGSPLGEAYVAFQDYARELTANALEPFGKHPEMVRRRTDVVSFVANWSDKASNIRAIARELNNGLDALVFLDDNPFERNLVRQELPTVAVPEVSDDPTYYPQAIADAGYFEGLSVTDDDRARSSQYQENKARDSLRLRIPICQPICAGWRCSRRGSDPTKQDRSASCDSSTKSNQLNLTGRRCTGEDVIAVLNDPDTFGFQLACRTGSATTGGTANSLRENKDLDIDTWLMSCRVLGRQVEPTTLNLIAWEANALGVRRLIGA